jgi:hypothetical protein
VCDTEARVVQDTEWKFSVFTSTGIISSATYSGSVKELDFCASQGTCDLTNGQCTCKAGFGTKTPAIHRFVPCAFSCADDKFHAVGCLCTVMYRVCVCVFRVCPDSLDCVCVVRPVCMPACPRACVNADCASPSILKTRALCCAVFMTCV